MKCVHQYLVHSKCSVSIVYWYQPDVGKSRLVKWATLQSRTEVSIKQGFWKRNVPHASIGKQAMWSVRIPVCYPLAA